ncbi:hypothetical protein F5144DRAFT_494912 [Chaetomium tenue]|uniref:Uncharacterized protein n=1 Tax=Chaetomium tenue TaxID=1854479 RepID=A0ACB7P278_9PEZI|nr:hypothetical protein F5144DRAFT_494912 [Chaetomium globosum]
MYRHESEEFADSVARALNASNIPCVLWGQYLLSLWGVPTSTPTLDFIIPDASLAAATEVMTTSTQFTRPLHACPDTGTCHWIPPTNRKPPPSFHLHIQDSADTPVVRLFLQSETLWILPPFNASLANPREHPLPPSLVLACDTTVVPRPRAGEGGGAFLSDETVVLVLKPEIMVEAYMRILVRDIDTPRCSYENLNYMLQYVEGRHFINHKLLSAPLSDVYEDLRDDTMPMPDLMDKLEDVGVGLPPVCYEGR